METAEDLVNELGGLLAFKQRELKQHEPLLDKVKLTPEERRLLDALGHDPVGVEQLVERLGDQVGVVTGSLIALEIKGLVAQTPYGYQRRD